MTFTAYLLQEVGRTWDEIYVTMVEDGYSEDEILTYYHDQRCNFDDYLEVNDLEEIHE